MPITRELKEQWEREFAAAEADHARKVKDADVAREESIAAAHARLLPLMVEGKAYSEYPHPLPILVRKGNAIVKVVPEPLYEQGVTT